jgi:hypothetical protein
MEAVRPAALSATKAAELVEVQVQLDWNQVHQRPPFWRRWRSGATAPAGAPMPSPSVAPAAPSAAVPLPEFVLPDANAEPAASPDPWGAPPDPAPWAPPPFGATLAPASSGDPWGTTAGQPAPGSLPDAAAGFADPASTARPATNNPWDHTGPAGGSPTF